MLFVAISGIILSSANSNTVFGFELNPLAFAGNIDLPDVICNVKATVNGLDENNEIIVTEDSTPFEKHPRTTFSLVGGIDNSDVTSFDINTKMRCDFIDTPFVDMTADSSDLTVIIFAKDSKGVEKQVWNNSVKSTSDVPIVNNHEETLSKVNARVVDIEKELEKGDYTTTLRFVVFGDVKLFYDVVSSVKYNVAIPDNKIQTFITLDVTKDTEPEDVLVDKELKEKPQDPSVTSINDIKELTTCIQTINTNCLLQSKFMPYYIGSFGLVFLVGALSTRNRPMFDQFGNRV